MEKRTSFLTTQFRAEELEDKLFIEGYFIKFNSETELWRNTYEKIAPESIVRSLKDADIRSLFNHDTSLVLGRTGNGTLELKADEVGLWGKVEINRQDSSAMDAYARIQRGDVTGCSFGFYPVNETYEEREDGGDLITVTDLDLFEISACTFPAYPQTEISARKKDVASFKREKLEIKKQKLKERLQK